MDANIIGKALKTANFEANFVAQFSIDSRTFVAVHDTTAGFNQVNDAIIEVTGLIGTFGL